MTERTALYRARSADGALLYAGISCRALARLAQHARDKDWWHEVCTVTLEWFDLRTEALLAEKRAIATERPRYNRVAGHQAPGGGVTPNRVIRMRQEWDELAEVAGKHKRAEVILQLVRWYLRYPGAKLPERPPRRDS